MLGFQKWYLSSRQTFYENRDPENVSTYTVRSISLILSTKFSLSISLCFSSYFSLSIYPTLTVCVHFNYGCCNHRNLVKCFFNLCEMLPAVKSLTFVHRFVISNLSLEALHKINIIVAAITSK